MTSINVTYHNSYLKKKKKTKKNSVKQKFIQLVIRLFITLNLMFGLATTYDMILINICSFLTDPPREVGELFASWLAHLKRVTPSHIH